MNQVKNNNVVAYYIVIFLSLFLVFIMTIKLPFFWDALSKVTRASWIYENNFKNLVVPSELNAGHPPLWISSLAFFWSIFGKSLWASRLLLYIINLGVFYQLFQLVKHLFSREVPLVLFFFICLEPTLLAQITSLNNNMLLLFFTLLTTNFYFKK